VPYKYGTSAASAQSDNLVEFSETDVRWDALLSEREREVSVERMPRTEQRPNIAGFAYKSLLRCAFGARKRVP